MVGVVIPDRMSCALCKDIKSGVFVRAVSVLQAAM
jgi:hypothetical protein